MTTDAQTALEGLRDEWHGAAAGLRRVQAAYMDMAGHLRDHAGAMNIAATHFGSMERHLAEAGRHLAEAYRTCRMSARHQHGLQAMISQAADHYWDAYGGESAQAAATAEVAEARAKVLTGHETKEQVAQLLDTMLAELRRLHGAGDAGPVSQAA